MNTYYTLITGASSGLGKSLALECAQRGMNLLLISLPHTELKNLSEFIKINFNIDVLYLELDLSITESFQEISDYIEKNNIQLKHLVNNAGVLSRDYFSELSEQFIRTQIEVNILAPTILTKRLLRNLKRNSPSYILNIGSIAGYFSLPKKQVYGASKSYLFSFSNSLRKELSKDHVYVTTVCPGPLNTTTEICYINRVTSWMTRNIVLTPEEVAKISIEGMFKRKKVIIPGFLNKLLMVVRKFMPEAMQDKITSTEIEKLDKITDNVYFNLED